MKTVADQLNIAIKNLTKMKSAALRELFHKVTGKEAPNNDRAFLIKTISSALTKRDGGKDGAAAEPDAKAKAPAKKPPAKSAAAPAMPKAPKAERPPRATDPRMPPVGTVLEKRDRHGAVRCEATVEDGGVRYKGQLYKSLSAAAMAAAKDLGGGGGAINGWTFFGITKPARAQRDPMIALDRAWERYRGNAEALVKTGITDDNRSQVRAAIKKHAAAIEALRENVA
jgi:hypothetical protein